MKESSLTRFSLFCVVWSPCESLSWVLLPTYAFKRYHSFYALHCLDSDNPESIKETLPDSGTWILASVTSLWEIANWWISSSLDLMTFYTLFLSHASWVILYLNIQRYALVRKNIPIPGNYKFRKSWCKLRIPNSSINFKFIEEHIIITFFIRNSKTC